jgi:hypothetical protein
VTFPGDFTLTIPYSDDPALVPGSNTGELAVVESSATAESAPNYTIVASGITVLTDADNIIVSATGTADLTAGVIPVSGQTYVILEASSLTTYDAINTAYLAGTPTAFTANIPAADFSLVGDDLTTTQYRTLIIANTVSNVRSYQRFQIAFFKAV